MAEKKFMVAIQGPASEIATRVNATRAVRANAEKPKPVDQLLIELRAKGQTTLELVAAFELVADLKRIAAGTGPEADKARRGLRMLGMPKGN